MRTKFLISIVLATFLFSSCSTIKISSDYDTAYNFNDIKTYAAIYESDTNKQDINELNKKRIDKHIKDQLNRRGLVENSESPDVIIKYGVDLEKEISINTSGAISGSSHGRIGYRGGYATGSKTATIDESTVGILRIEMFNSDSNELIWYSAGSNTLPEGVKAKEAEKRIGKAIDKIMDEFPIQKLN
jgi:hypothetical protein